MYSFPSLEPVCCSMSGSNCCFLTCVQFSQKEGKVVWYFHHFKNFLEFVVTHTFKGFSIVNEAEVDVFLEFFCFLHDPADVGNLISGSSAFSKTSLNIWKFPYWKFDNTWNIWKFTYCGSLAWRILSITLLACEMSAIMC